MTAASTDDQSRTAALYVPDLNAGGLDVITKGLIQVWYSTNTLQKLEAEIVHASPLRLACLSCPSVYFHLSEEARAKCGASNFEYDRRWADDKNFVFYDCYAPSNVEESLHGQFDFLIADPPSLQTSVLENYATTIRLLAAPGARILFSTFDSFQPTMSELLGLSPQRFKPALPGLGYAESGRWSFYANFASVALCLPNEELANAGAADEPDDGWAEGFHTPQHEI
uniref:Uncharacterized protein n=1 Tax=Prymnesium polylepis TaxID=72548 RepID=A0A7S4M2W1_9EUKA